MLYYKDTNLVIRDMQEGDIDKIHQERMSQGWHSNVSVYER